MVVILASVGDLLLQTGELETAAELLSLIVQHSATPHFIRTRAQQSLTLTQAGLSTKAFEAATQRGVAGELSHRAATIRDQLPNWKDVYATASTHNSRKVEQSLVDPLSERELEVLHLIADGLSNTEIAGRLFVGLSTVKKHINHIYSKLGVETRDQVVARAQQLQLI